MLFVSHRTRRVTVVERAMTGWVEGECRAGEQVSLQSPSVTFAVDDVYADIVLDPA